MYLPFSWKSTFLLAYSLPFTYTIAYPSASFERRMYTLSRPKTKLAGILIERGINSTVISFEESSKYLSP